jgi:hypothetical protein
VLLTSIKKLASYKMKLLFFQAIAWALVIAAPATNAQTVAQISLGNVSVVPSAVPLNQQPTIPMGVSSILSSHEPSGVTSSSTSTPPFIPSATPSSAPSDDPSAVPSDVPSGSVTPSSAPSGDPSVIPSDVPSGLPSCAPSNVASNEPSNLPSDMPSEVPSAQPSGLPSGAPSNVASNEPSNQPSDMPSDVPSVNPSFEPSAPPTNSPAPSSSPSVEPSEVPSPVPSMSPSQYPSGEPTASPSGGPSDVPSEFPTLACHDQSSYRSPLNDFECKDHQGTDCIQWRFLGLKIEQVIELIQNCPVSCNVDCGEEQLQPFEVTLSFGLLRVSSFLAPNAVATLESVSVEYMTNFIRAQEEESQFFLYEVELLSQNLLGRRRLRALPSRRLASAVNLVVTVAFRGYAIDMHSQVAEEYLVKGIDSTGYERSLQRSGDLELLEAQISSQVDPDSINRATPSEDNAGGKGVVAASVVIAALAVFAASAFFFHVRKRRLTNVQKQVNPIDLGSDDVISPPASVRSALSRVLSLEGILSMVSSPRSQDSSTVAGGSSGMSEREQPQQSPSSEEETEEEHPLTGIIPPMIVFDNIDEMIPAEGDQRTKLRGKSVVPSKHMDATPDFVAQLRTGIWKIDESLMHFPEPDKKFFACSDENSSTSSRSSRSDTDDDDDDDGNGDDGDDNGDDGEVTSVCSAPMEISIADEVTQLESIERSEIRRCISESEAGLPPSIPTRRVLGRQRRKPSLAESDITASPAHSTGRQQFSFFSDVPGGDRATISQPVLDQVDGKHGETYQGFMHSIFSLSPNRKHRKVVSASTDGSPNRNHRKTTSTDGSPHSTSSGTAMRRKMKSSDSKGSDSSFDKTSIYKNGKDLIFQIPRHGKLGLTILCDEKEGPMVQVVKDYSPLLGKAMPSDRIVSIDGVPTLGATLSDVTSLLSRKSGSRWPQQSNAMDIVFWRPKEENNKDDNVSDNNDTGVDEVSNASRPGLPRQQQRQDVPSLRQRIESIGSFDNMPPSRSISPSTDQSDEDRRRRFY